jgi:uncharacterized protein (TIGR03083 family)
MADGGIDHGLDHVEVLAAEGAALIAAVRQGPLSSPIVACPGWVLTDVARHVGTVWRWSTQVLSERRQEPGAFVPEPEHLPDDEAVAWLESGLVGLLDALRSCPPETPVWGFGLKPRTAAFWSRRMTFETVIHRVDAELALGVPAPVQTAVASDGIGEFVDVLLPRQYYRKDMPPGQLVVTVSDTGDVYSHGDPTAGTATLRGPAEDLLLQLWERRISRAVEEGGDVQILAGWKALGAP